jgi:hypothetical protein
MLKEVSGLGDITWRNGRVKPNIVLQGAHCLGNGRLPINILPD